MKFEHKKNQGFVALISIVLISFVLLIAVITLNKTSYINRYNVYNFELKETSKALAEACTNLAFLELSKNPSYTVTTPEVKTINGNTCTIHSVTGTPKTIKAKSNYKNFHTNITVVTSNPPLQITSWTEVPNF